MGKVSEVEPDSKIHAVQDYLAGKYSLRQLGIIYNVHHSSVEHWVTLYRACGPEGFYRNGKNQRYSKEVRQQAVKRYLSTKESMYSICEELKIRSVSQLRYWVTQYKKEQE